LTVRGSTCDFSGGKNLPFYYIIIKSSKQRGQGNFFENFPQESSHFKKEGYEIAKRFFSGFLGIVF
jgi:ribosomal protein S16